MKKAILNIDDVESEKVLRTPSNPITKFDQTLGSLVIDMIDTMKSDVICIGLSAPQIGVSKQVVIICLDRNYSKPLIIINPTNVVEFGKKDIKRETCMSLPDRCGNVQRRENLSFDYQTATGDKSSLQLCGFEARAVAHELDHLNGVLYSDKLIGELSPISFDQIREKLRSR